MFKNPLLGKGDVQGPHSRNADTQRASVQEFYFVDRVVKHKKDLTSLPRKFLYCVKWLGNDAQTWEPAFSLRCYMIFRYHKCKKMAVLLGI